MVSIVVEPPSIRGLAAGRPCISIIFELSRLGLFHPYVVAYRAYGMFQQLTGFKLHLTYQFMQRRMRTMHEASYF